MSDKTTAIMTPADYAAGIGPSDAPPSQEVADAAQAELSWETCPPEAARPPWLRRRRRTPPRQTAALERRAVKVSSLVKHLTKGESPF
jgi:hypothetical protein